MVKVSVGMIGATATACEAVVPVKFCMIWPIGYGVDPKPWQVTEKQLVREIVASIDKRAPGLIRRVTIYRPLIFYRGTRVSAKA